MQTDRQYESAKVDAAAQALPRAAVHLVISRGISNMGAMLTAFGLDVWVLRETGSYAAFAYLAALATLPSLLFAPFAGIMADRYAKKRLLILADLASLLMVGATLLVYLLGSLHVAMVAACILLLALATELRWSVLGASIVELVPQAQLGRINGLQQAMRGISVMLGPVLGALGLEVLGLALLLQLDLLTYIVALLALLTLPPGSLGKVAKPAVFGSFWQELSFGFRWVFTQPGLRRLLLFFMVINIGVAIFNVSFAPYILSFANTGLLGLGLGLQGAGAFLCGLALARWRKAGIHAQQNERHIVWGSLGFGLCMLVWGISRAQPLLLLAVFALGCMSSVIIAASHTIWQSHVPPEFQGKVFAVRTVFSFGLTPLAIFASVPLALSVFQPLLISHPLLTATWGQGKSGALGMMVSVLGLGVMLSSLFLHARGGLRLPPLPTSPASASRPHP